MKLMCVCWYSHPDFVKFMHVIKCGMHLLLANEDVWRELNTQPVNKLDSPLPWYPKTSGYEVVMIKKGTVDCYCSLNYM